MRAWGRFCRFGSRAVVASDALTSTATARSTVASYHVVDADCVVTVPLVVVGKRKMVVAMVRHHVVPYDALAKASCLVREPDADILFVGRLRAVRPGSVFPGPANEHVVISMVSVLHTMETAREAQPSTWTES